MAKRKKLLNPVPRWKNNTWHVIWQWDNNLYSISTGLEDFTQNQGDANFLHEMKRYLAMEAPASPIPSTHPRASSGTCSHGTVASTLARKQPTAIRNCGLPTTRRKCAKSVSNRGQTPMFPCLKRSKRPSPA